MGESRQGVQVLRTIPMTINNIFSVLSSSELVLELKVIKVVVESPVQALKAIYHLSRILKSRDIIFVL